MTAVREAPLQGVRLLLVEDDDHLRPVLAEALADLGIVILAQARDGDDGWACFQRHRPDIVLSDIWMAPGDGLSLARRIRALDAEQGGLTPAIAMTAGAKVEAALDAGFHACFLKPFQLPLLQAAIEDFVRDDGRVAARWTWTPQKPDHFLLTLTGEATPADTRGYCSALLALLHAAGRPCDITVDLRDLERFSLAVPSATERALWPERRLIRSARVLGASRVAGILAKVTCGLLGIPCTFETSSGDTAGSIS